MKVSHGKKQAIPNDVKANIYKLDWMDQKLYQHFNTSLWKQINAEVGFWDDFAEFKTIQSKLAVDCASFSHFDVDDHRVRMLGEKGRIPDAEMKCHLLQLDSEGIGLVVPREERSVVGRRF
jgi:hypothetical protein